MRKFYGILNGDGKLYMTWMLQPWMSSDLGSTKKTALTIGGKAVRVETVIYTPKSRANSALTEGRSMNTKQKVASKKVAKKKVAKNTKKKPKISEVF